MRSSTSTRPSHLPSNYSTLVTLHPTVTPRPEGSGRRWHLYCPMSITHSSQSLVQAAAGSIGLSKCTDGCIRELRDTIEMFLDISNQSYATIQRTSDQDRVQMKYEKKTFLDAIIWSTNQSSTNANDISVEVEHTQMSLNRANRIKKWAKTKVVKGIDVSDLMKDDFKRVYYGCNCQYPCERDNDR
ncbi:hypothetical protein I203_104696 [Kwoniella mangroviensis CBS 8507]|uniref:uncharacterized protein n=1 Tax=Kwoniella mangroviensis CBS 8507 TaxID=1296122 RepID=UPI00080D43C4|nr:uncharacterized protein I203_00359 [Kwoniella mangroviensis CBS 8507]OCF70227.1 hypothetical protein I203_00359 [Kwoniella mangroviensis CBS 8507]